MHKTEAAVEQAGKNGRAKEAWNAGHGAAVKAGTNAKASREADNILTKFEERLMPPLRNQVSGVSRMNAIR